MEFEGRISKVLPTKGGTRQDGTEWKSLPFVFEYYENESDRYPDSVLLETTDHNYMRSIGQFVVRGSDNKAVVKDGQCELTGEIKCRCGFSHRANTYKKKDGTEGMTTNMRVYKLEIITPTLPSTAAQQQQAPSFPPPYPEHAKESDELPF